MDKCCGWCKDKAVLSCGNCSQVSYCSKEHQKKHWNQHKNECKAYKIAEKTGFGRFLVASRNLAAGSLVIKESPLVVGPQATSPLVCLGCHSPVTKNNFDKCPICSWPMCSATQCPGKENHEEECQVLKRDLKKSGVPQRQGETPRYDLVLLLRCLLLKDKNEVAWNYLKNLEGHGSSRMQQGEPHHVAAVRFASEVFKMDFDLDSIHHTRGAIITNCINTKNPNGLTFRGIYSIISLLNHSCLPNLTLRSDSNHTLYIRTAVDVKKDEPLTFSYVPASEPVWKRQEDLRNIYHFNCNCFRCSDPKELGIHFSNFKCAKCSNIIEACLQTSGFKCINCEIEITTKEINKRYSDEMEFIRSKRIDPKHLSLFLKNISEKYHTSHFLYLEALRKCVKVLAEQNSLKNLEVRKSLWEQIIRIYQVIEPGLTRKKGIFLLNLAKVRVEICRLQISPKKKAAPRFDSSDKVQDTYENIYSDLIKPAKAILKLEPPESTELAWFHEVNQLEEKVLKEIKSLQK